LRDLEMLVCFLLLGFAILLLKQESKRVAVQKTWNMTMRAVPLTVVRKVPESLLRTAG